MNSSNIIKKYSSDNFFINDITRESYKINDFKNETNSLVNRFESDILLNSKEKFDSNNDRLNSLQDEIVSLKNKLKTVYDKEKEINKLNIENKKFQSEIEENKKIIDENNNLKLQNSKLSSEIDQLNIKLMNIDTLKQENKLLKDKLKNYLKDENEDTITNENEHIEHNELINNDLVSEEQIIINISKLKDILSNRLQKYHEDHIDSIIKQYDLKDNNSIGLSKMGKILEEAIHI